MLYAECTILFTDADSSARGEYYLPGAPIEVSDWSCEMCGESMSIGFNNATGREVKRYPYVGDHDGIVRIVHDDVDEGAEEFVHARCAFEAVDEGSMTMTFVVTSPMLG